MPKLKILAEWNLVDFDSSHQYEKFAGPFLLLIIINVQYMHFALGLFLMQAVISFIASPIVHRWGSKKMLTAGLIIILLGLTLLLVSTLVKVEGMQHLSLVALVVYFIGAGAGPMISLLALPTEITTQVARPTVLWLSGIIFWLFATGVAFVTPYLLKSIGGFTYIIFLFMVLLEVGEFANCCLYSTMQRCNMQRPDILYNAACSIYFLMNQTSIVIGFG